MWSSRKSISLVQTSAVLADHLSPFSHQNFPLINHRESRLTLLRRRWSTGISKIKEWRNTTKICFGKKTRHNKGWTHDAPRSNPDDFPSVFTSLTYALNDISTRILVWWSSLKNHCSRGSGSFPLLHSGVSVLTLATNEASHEGLPLLRTFTLKTVQKHKAKGNNVFVVNVWCFPYLLVPWWCFKYTD